MQNKGLGKDTPDQWQQNKSSSDDVLTKVNSRSKGLNKQNKENTQWHCEKWPKIYTLGSPHPPAKKQNYKEKFVLKYYNIYSFF